MTALAIPQNFQSAPTRETTQNVLSALFALFIVVFPWEWGRGDEFADLVNYTTRIYDLRDYGMRAFAWDNSLIGWLKFEYLWFALLAVVAQSDIHPDTFLAIVTFVSTFFTHRFLRQHIGFGLAALVLTNPISIDLVSSQIRSALAFAFFLALAGGPGDQRFAKLRWAAMLLLPFIHTAMSMVVAIYAGSRIVTVLPRMSAMTRIFLVASGALVMVVLMATVLPSLADEAGDRRQLADYGTKSGAYVLYWLLVGVAFVVSCTQANTARWVYIFATFICLMGPLSEFLGLPGFRFVALAVPIIFAAMPMLKQEIRQGTIIMTACYAGLLIYYWVR